MATGKFFIFGVLIPIPSCFTTHQPFNQSMKRPILFLASIISALSLTSCLQNETTIHLNKDGSGTLVEETTLGAQMMAMMDQMSALGGIAPGAGGGADKKDPVAEMFSEEKAKARAAKLGEGVTLEKNETIDKKGNKGGRATYHFADINKLKISASDGMKDMSPMGDQAPAGKKVQPHRLHLRCRRTYDRHAGA